MDIVQIVLLALVASLLFMMLKNVQPTFSFFILMVTSIFILVIIIKQVGVILTLISTLGEKAQIDSFYLQTILKIIGIAYITELGANITRDAGLSSVASKVELAGKMFIIFLSIPIISAVVELIVTFLPVTF